MSCIKNPKKFLFFKWFGPHKLKQTYIKSMLTPGTYLVNYECGVCGVEVGDDIVSQNTLLHQGYNLEKLQEMSNNRYSLGKTPEELF